MNGFFGIILVAIIAVFVGFFVRALIRRSDGERGEEGERSLWEERELDVMLADQSSPGGSPRRQHYEFAHLLLPQRFFSDAKGLYRILCDDEGITLLEALWREAKSDMLDDDIDSKDLSRSTHLGPSDSNLMIIKLPLPKAVTEAYFVGLVVGENYRYFTLELGFDEGGIKRTVFCEWKNGAHFNYGDGPSADVEAFAATIRAYLDDQTN